MRDLRYILLILSLCPLMVWGQRRFSTAEQWEYHLAKLSGFTDKDVNNSTDVLFGLHASQYTGSHHLIGFALEGSWSTFVSNMPTVANTPGGGAAGFNLLYEYQYSGILFQTGLGINYQCVYNNIADTSIYHYNMMDTWSGINPVPFTLRHRFEGRRDQAQMVYGQLPLYIGHYIPGPLGIGYFLAGVKLNYAFWGNTKQTLKGSTSGLYERYIGVWEEMDNHGFRKDVPLERTGKQLQVKFDVMAHLEIGYEYTSFQNPHSYRIMPNDRLDWRLRIAGFADFGIVDICPRTNNVYYGIPDATIYDFPTYRMDHVFSTADAKRYWMRNLFVGVRITMLFGFQGKERCILCDPWRH